MIELFRLKGFFIRTKKKHVHDECITDGAKNQHHHHHKKKKKKGKKVFISKSVKIPETTPFEVKRKKFSKTVTIGEESEEAASQEGFVQKVDSKSVELKGNKQ